ncbi:MAG: hypothetical protein ACOC32_03795 [Nanoarchaeota archaeon]
MKHSLIDRIFTLNIFTALFLPASIWIVVYALGHSFVCMGCIENVPLRLLQGLGELIFLFFMISLFYTIMKKRRLKERAFARGKKVLFIISLIVFFLIIMVNIQKLIFEIAADLSRQKSAYYAEIKKTCTTPECFATVNYMEEHEYMLADDGNCPEGYFMNGFKGSIYNWCEPIPAG